MRLQKINQRSATLSCRDRRRTQNLAGSFFGENDIQVSFSPHIYDRSVHTSGRKKASICRACLLPEGVFLSRAYTGTYTPESGPLRLPQARRWPRRYGRETSADRRCRSRSGVPGLCSPTCSATPSQIRAQTRRRKACSG